MKPLFTLIVTLVLCSACIRLDPLTYSIASQSTKRFKVVRIKEEPSIYFVYLKRDGYYFKTITDKSKAPISICRSIKTGGYYHFDLEVILPLDSLFGMPVMPNLGVVMVYKESYLSLEYKYHYTVYKITNIEGLCMDSAKANK